MKFEKVEINNYGAISAFSYEFSQNKPLVLFGKNGSGKTLLISQLVDSLIEMKRHLFHENIPEVKGSNYFRLGSKLYIKSGTQLSTASIRFSDGSKYFDAMSKAPEQDIQQLEDLHFSLDKDKFKAFGFSRQLNTSIKREDFEKECYVYFPIDRYYVPNWQNDENYTKFVDQSAKNFIERPSSNLVKNNVWSNIGEWLYKLFLSPDIVQTDRGISINKPAIKDLVIQIFRIVLGDTFKIIQPNRKNNSVHIINDKNAVVEINSLSSGEIMMIGIFLSLLREMDLITEVRSFSTISGICIIDEIDLNIHIEQQTKILPKLISLFPNVQFIISTHSPFFAQGMFNLFGKNVDFLMMPSCKIATDFYDLSEIKDAIEAFGGDQSLIEKISKVEAELKRLSLADKINIITEGKTDAKFLKKAYEKLGISSADINIIGNDDGDKGDSTLKSFLTSQVILGGSSNKIIGIFDNDNETITKWIGSGIKEIVPKRVYAFCLPIPPKRTGQTKISIEHYFTDEEIRTFDGEFRLYQAGEFNSLGILKTTQDRICKYLSNCSNKIDPNYVLSGSDNKKVFLSDTDKYGEKNVSLSKDDFCDNVVTDKPGFDSFDFSDFKLIIDEIENIKAKMI